MAPWRILEQTIVMRTPDGEVGPALQFTIDPADSTKCRLRIVAADPDAEHYEVVFTTGGLVIEQVYQPRVLKPFQRGPIIVPPDPVEIVDPKNPEAKLLVNPLTNRPETDDEKLKREALQTLKDKREGVEAEKTQTASNERVKTLEELNAEEAAKRNVIDTATVKSQTTPAG